jgi:hypothetical protein
MFTSYMYIASLNHTYNRNIVLGLHIEVHSTILDDSKFICMWTDKLGVLVELIIVIAPTTFQTQLYPIYIPYSNLSVRSCCLGCFLGYMQQIMIGYGVCLSPDFRFFSH